MAGDLTYGPGFQTIGIWLQGALSADGKKREPVGCEKLLRREKFLRRLSMSLQSIGLNEKGKAGI